MGNSQASQSTPSPKSPPDPSSVFTPRVIELTRDLTVPPTVCRYSLEYSLLAAGNTLGEVLVVGSDQVVALFRTPDAQPVVGLEFLEGLGQGEMVVATPMHVYVADLQRQAIARVFHVGGPAELLAVTDKTSYDTISSGSSSALSPSKPIDNEATPNTVITCAYLLRPPHVARPTTKTSRTQKLEAALYDRALRGRCLMLGYSDGTVRSLDLCTMTLGSFCVKLGPYSETNTQVTGSTGTSTSVPTTHSGPTLQSQTTRTPRVVSFGQSDADIAQLFALITYGDENDPEQHLASIVSIDVYAAYRMLHLVLANDQATFRIPKLCTPGDGINFLSVDQVCLPCGAPSQPRIRVSAVCLSANCADELPVPSVATWLVPHSLTHEYIEKVGVRCASPLSPVVLTPYAITTVEVQKERSRIDGLWWSRCGTSPFPTKDQSKDQFTLSQPLPTRLPVLFLAIADEAAYSICGLAGETSLLQLPSEPMVTKSIPELCFRMPRSRDDASNVHVSKDLSRCAPPIAVDDRLEGIVLFYFYNGLHPAAFVKPNILAADHAGNPNPGDSERIAQLRNVQEAFDAIWCHETDEASSEHEDEEPCGALDESDEFDVEKLLQEVGLTENQTDTSGDSKEGVPSLENTTTRLPTGLEDAAGPERPLLTESLHIPLVLNPTTLEISLCAQATNYRLSATDVNVLLTEHQQDTSLPPASVGDDDIPSVISYYSQQRSLYARGGLNPLEGGFPSNSSSHGTTIQQMLAFSLYLSPHINDAEKTDAPILAIWSLPRVECAPRLVQTLSLADALGVKFALCAHEEITHAPFISRLVGSDDKCITFNLVILFSMPSRALVFSFDLVYDLRLLTFKVGTVYSSSSLGKEAPDQPTPATSPSLHMCFSDSLRQLVVFGNTSYGSLFLCRLPEVGQSVIVNSPCEYTTILKAINVGGHQSTGEALLLTDRCLLHATFDIQENSCSLEVVEAKNLVPDAQQQSQYDTPTFMIPLNKYWRGHPLAVAGYNTGDVKVLWCRAKGASRDGQLSLDPLASINLCQTYPGVLPQTFVIESCLLLTPEGRPLKEYDQILPIPYTKGHELLIPKDSTSAITFDNMLSRSTDAAHGTASTVPYQTLCVTWSDGTVYGISVLEVRPKDTGASSSPPDLNLLTECMLQNERGARSWLSLLLGLKAESIRAALPKGGCGIARRRATLSSLLAIVSDKTLNEIQRGLPLGSTFQPFANILDGSSASAPLSASQKMLAFYAQVPSTATLNADLEPVPAAPRFDVSRCVPGDYANSSKTRIIWPSAPFSSPTAYLLSPVVCYRSPKTHTRILPSSGSYIHLLNARELQSISELEAEMKKAAEANKPSEGLFGRLVNAFRDKPKGEDFIPPCEFMSEYLQSRKDFITTLVGHLCARLMTTRLGMASTGRSDMMGELASGQASTLSPCTSELKSNHSSTLHAAQSSDSDRQSTLAGSEIDRKAYVLGYSSRTRHPSETQAAHEKFMDAHRERMAKWQAQREAREQARLEAREQARLNDELVSRNIEKLHDIGDSSDRLNQNSMTFLEKVKELRRRQEEQWWLPF